MNRERTAKLLKRTGLAVLKRPDGGVVTQRTANPLSFSPKWLKTAKFSESFSSWLPLFVSRRFRERSPNLLTLGAGL
jgi:hypothetical protein